MRYIDIVDADIEITAVRSPGAGGQHVNKVATAAHLRFDIRASSLPSLYKEKLLALSDQRISQDGIVVIKASRYRSLEKNREDALQRLRELIKQAVFVHKKRKATKPTRASQRKRLDAKSKHKEKKASRRKLDY